MDDNEKQPPGLAAPIDTLPTSTSLTNNGADDRTRHSSSGSAADVEKNEVAAEEPAVIPTGIPFGAATAPIPVAALARTGTQNSLASTARLGSEKATSSNGPPTEKKGVSFGKRRKQKDAEEKKAKEKEGEANALKPVGITQLFRFATPFELFCDAIGLIVAIAAGAAQPLMTLIFSRLTKDFTDFGIIQNSVAAGDQTAETQARLDAAKHALRISSRNNALYLVAIGVGMFLCTWLYMFVWNWTGEANAKRIREKYLHATLRQDIAYFDDLGAGEVATRIQTDCHLVQEGTSEKIALIVMFSATFVTGFVLAYVREWRLALALSSILPCILITGGAMQFTMVKSITKSLESVSKAGSVAEEVIASIRTVHAFGTGKLLRGRFSKHIEEMRVNGKKSTIGEIAGLSVICELYAT